MALILPPLQARGGVQPRGREFPERRHGLVIGWDGTLSDCDFNLGPGMDWPEGPRHSPTCDLPNGEFTGAAALDTLATPLSPPLHTAMPARPERVRVERSAPVTRSGRDNQSTHTITRLARLGKVKTRLTPPLSAEEALGLHHTCYTTRFVMRLPRPRWAKRESRPAPTSRYREQRTIGLDAVLIAINEYGQKRAILGGCFSR